LKNRILNKNNTERDIVNDEKFVLLERKQFLIFEGVEIKFD